MTELRGESGARYEILDAPFAYGRACALYLVKDSDDGRQCVKLFKAVPRVVGGRRHQKEFVKEFAAQQSLKHANILPVLDVGTAGRGGPPFIVYPFCDGGSLRDRMSSRDFMPLTEVLAILWPIALALDHAHTAGFIHGDVKPENVLFSQNENSGPYLSDFGMSRYYVEESVDRATTMVELEFRGGGSYAYMSPEQLDDGVQSPRSDIYALAVVTYEMLTGKSPFSDEKSVYRQMKAKVEGMVDRRSSEHANLSERAWKALLAGLARNPRDRPRSAGDFCRLLSGDEVHVAAASGRKGPAGRLAQWWDGLDAKVKAAVITGAIAALATIVTALINIIPALLE